MKLAEKLRCVSYNSNKFASCDPFNFFLQVIE